MPVSPKSLANLKPCKPGEVRNPGGRPRVPEDVKQMARGLAPEAIQTLAEIMRDKDATAPARVSAASIILDRGYGKAPQHITTERIDDLSDAELATELTDVLAGLRALGIDGASGSAHDEGPGAGDAPRGPGKPH